MSLFDLSSLGEKRKHARLRVLPTTPASDWQPPQEYPDLRSADLIAFDVETKERDFDNGPGWARGMSHIVGASVAAQWSSGRVYKAYYPMRHEVDTHHNLDAAKVIPWLREQLESNVPKIGANLIFDIGCLTDANIFVCGKLHDVQFAEALLNETGHVNLQHLGRKYLNEGKQSNALYEWCACAYGGKATDKQRANIYRAPPSLVGSYAESDADLPLRILPIQYREIEKQGLTEVFDLENKLIPLLVRMRMQGVQVDLAYAEKLYDELSQEARAINSELNDIAGAEINVASSATIAKAFDAAGLSYPQTALGNPSFTKEFLESEDNEIAKKILEIREREKICSTFLRNYILEKNVNGRLHCSFHPLRGEDEGTRSGRFSSSDPNLQNIPSRSELGKRVRKAFTIHKNSFCYRKIDYSQIEYRCLAHYAVGPKADYVRDTYANDPGTDYHRLTQDLVKELTGQVIDRTKIKSINFGLLYGMGMPKLARTLGLTKDEATELFEAYHTGNPYVAKTMEAAVKEVQILGHITTILGRRSRFDRWQPKDGHGFDLPYDQALVEYGQAIKRAHTHKAINRRLQGSAADIIKKAMVALLDSGVFDQVGVPLLQVHDELDFEVSDDSSATREAFAFITHTMETAQPLRVPVSVDVNDGPSWGAVE